MTSMASAAAENRSSVLTVGTVVTVAARGPGTAPIPPARGWVGSGEPPARPTGDRHGSHDRRGGVRVRGRHATAGEAGDGAGRRPTARGAGVDRRRRPV